MPPLIPSVLVPSIPPSVRDRGHWAGAQLRVDPGRALQLNEWIVAQCNAGQMFGATQPFGATGGGLPGTWQSCLVSHGKTSSSR